MKRARTLALLAGLAGSAACSRTCGSTPIVTSDAPSAAPVNDATPPVTFAVVPPNTPCYDNFTKAAFTSRDELVWSCGVDLQLRFYVTDVQKGITRTFATPHHGGSWHLNGDDLVIEQIDAADRFTDRIVYDLEGRERSRKRVGRAGRFNPDGSLFACLAWSPTLGPYCVLDVRTGRDIDSTPHVYGAARPETEWSPDGLWLYRTFERGTDTSTDVFDVVSGRGVSTCEPLDGSDQHIAWARRSTRFVQLDEHRFLSIWDTATRDLLPPIWLPFRPQIAALDATGTRAAVLSPDGVVAVVEPIAGVEPTTMKAFAERCHGDVRQLVWSPNGRVVACSNATGGLALFANGSLARVFAISEPHGPYDVLWSLSSTIVAMVGPGIVRLFRESSAHWVTLVVTKGNALVMFDDEGHVDGGLADLRFRETSVDGGAPLTLDEVEKKAGSRRLPGLLSRWARGE